MEEATCHPLVVARRAVGMKMEEFVSGIHAAAARRHLRSGIDEARVRKWQRGVRPSEESQIYIAEALGWPADIVIFVGSLTPAWGGRRSPGRRSGYRCPALQESDSSPA
ncbi:hypothetical protein [Streptomyces flaveus]|uniref:hypothetical protein n=1 Tax=Streptomyces flaveus TaxID=66370 RepID=UPI0033194980